MAEDFTISEGNRCITQRVDMHSSPESENMACIKSGGVNVGDPTTPAKEAVLVNKSKQ